MKFLGVSGVFDYAGPNKSSRYRACSCCLPRISRASASGLTVYGAEYPPRLSSVYASLCTSRYPAQDSRPSGSLLLSRKALSSSASCRFIPAHCNGLIVTYRLRLDYTRAFSQTEGPCYEAGNPAALQCPCIRTKCDASSSTPQG